MTTDNADGMRMDLHRDLQRRGQPSTCLSYVQPVESHSTAAAEFEMETWMAGDASPPPPARPLKLKQSNWSCCWAPCL